ncbi:MAG: S8 family serine peptidase [Defluviitaleaceae bacterium]|nr:S8 family serine peptidase [Defluviitaleaceae bacterium]
MKKKCVLWLLLLALLPVMLPTESLSARKIASISYDCCVKNNMPILTRRIFAAEEIIRTTIFGDVSFVRGEILILGGLDVLYSEMRTYVEQHGGKVVGFLETANVYQVYFSDSTPEDLYKLLDTFNSNDIIELAVLNVVNVVNNRVSRPIPGVQRHPLEPIYTHPLGQYVIPENMSWSYQWSMHTINAPRAWVYNDMMASINVGVVDFFLQEYVDTLCISLIETNAPRPYGGHLFSSHRGIHEASIIGNISNRTYRDVGLLWNAQLFGYPLLGVTLDTYVSDFVTRRAISLFDIKHAISTLFAHDVNLINIGMGWEHLNSAGNEFNIYEASNIALRIERDALTIFLGAYLSLGQDFLIVQFAERTPNTSTLFSRELKHLTNVGYSGFFVNIDDDNIKSRIIIVGGMERMGTGKYRLYSSSPIGSRIDVIAPERNLYAISIAGSRFHSGASTSTPHVTGVAGMVWSINPYLTGAEVKEIIINNAHEDIMIEVIAGINENGEIFTEILPVLDAGLAVEAAARTLEE